MTQGCRGREYTAQSMAGRRGSRLAPVLMRTLLTDLAWHLMRTCLLQLKQ